VDGEKQYGEPVNVTDPGSGLEDAVVGKERWERKGLQASDWLDPARSSRRQEVPIGRQYPGGPEDLAERVNDRWSGAT
jgi:hypothetical protein